MYYVVFLCNCKVSTCYNYISDAGRLKIFGVPVVIGGDYLSSLGWNRVNWSAKYCEGGHWSPWPPGSGITATTPCLSFSILLHSQAMVLKPFWSSKKKVAISGVWLSHPVQWVKVFHSSAISFFVKYFFHLLKLSKIFEKKWLFGGSTSRTRYMLLNVEEQKY